MKLDATLPALPNRSAGLLATWSMLPGKKRGRRWREEKKEKNKNFFQCPPLPLFRSLPFPPFLSPYSSFGASCRLK